MVADPAGQPYLAKDGALTVLEQGRLRDVSIMRSCAASGARGFGGRGSGGRARGASFRTGYRHSPLRGGEGGNLAPLADGANHGDRPSPTWKRIGGGAAVLQPAGGN